MKNEAHARDLAHRVRMQVFERAAATGHVPQPDRSEEHVDNWCELRDLPRGALLTPAQAWRLAAEWYGKKLQPDWRRHTLEETEALFRQLDLTGPFWSLRGA